MFQWRTTQSWQQTPENYQQNAKVFSPKDQKRSKRQNVLKKNISLQDVSMNIQNAVLEKPPKPFWQKDETFSPKLWNRSKGVLFFRRYFSFSSKCLYAHLKCSFDNAGEFLSTEGLIYFSKNPKTRRIMIFWKKLFLFKFFPHRREDCNVDKAPKNYQKKTKNTSLIIRKRSKKYSWKKIIYRDVSMNIQNLVWADPLKNLWQNEGRFAHNFWKRFKKIYTFFRKNISR